MGLVRDTQDSEVGWTTMPSLSILVVEDDAMIGKLLAEMLVDMGYDVCAIVATEEDAVADAAQHRPDLMIVDECLREGSGASAVDRILLSGQVPCVFISGAFTNRRPAGAMLLQKPFMEADLVRAIQRVTGSSDGYALGRPVHYPS
jgi:two-component system, response regulator PdtaR